MPSTRVIAGSNFQDLIHGRSELDPMRVIITIYFGRPTIKRCDFGLPYVIIGTYNELVSFSFDTG